LAVAPVQDRVEAGQPVTFNIDVTNNGDRPLTNVYVTATGDTSIIHESGEASVRDNKDGPLQPGETWRKKVVFTPTASGRRCIMVDAFSDGGQRASQEACVLVINPVPLTPSLTATIDGKSRVLTGDNTLVRTRIVNDGRAEARNVNVDMGFDPQLQLIAATEGANQQRIGQRILSWTIPSIAPGQAVTLEGQFRSVAPSPQSRVSVTAQSAEGARATDNFEFEIAGPSAPPRTTPPPSLPPAGTAPEIPGGIAPLQGNPSNGNSSNGAQPNAPAQPLGPARSGRLQTVIVPRNNGPVRVNETIRYGVRVTNDSNIRDGQVGIQFGLPPGVRLERLVPLTNPELSDYRIDAGVVSLPFVPILEPGESAEFEVVLSGNQPQPFDFNVGVRSTNQPDGFAESVRTIVLP
jgi:hypothetical protein